MVRAMRILLLAILLAFGSIAHSANTNQMWKGAVAPAQVSPSGNEFRRWKGAVEPSDDPAGGDGGVFIRVGQIWSDLIDKIASIFVSREAFAADK